MRNWMPIRAIERHVLAPNIALRLNRLPLLRVRLRMRRIRQNKRGLRTLLTVTRPLDPRVPRHLKLARNVRSELVDRPRSRIRVIAQSLERMSLPSHNRGNRPQRNQFLHKRLSLVLLVDLLQQLQRRHLGNDCETFCAARGH
jgi:hypothetical protein